MTYTLLYLNRNREAFSDNAAQESLALMCTSPYLALWLYAWTHVCAVAHMSTCMRTYSQEYGQLRISAHMSGDMCAELYSCLRTCANSHTHVNARAHSFACVLRAFCARGHTSTCTHTGGAVRLCLCVLTYLQAISISHTRVLSCRRKNPFIQVR